jgi:hypothetical protein
MEKGLPSAKVAALSRLNIALRLVKTGKSLAQSMVQLNPSPANAG